MMRYPAKVTAEKRELALRRASELFRRKGSEGVTVSQVMEAAGMTHGTFYCHFNSKDDLVVEAIATANDDFAKQMQAKTRNKSDPKRAYLNAYLSTEHRDAPARGCPLASLGCEIARNEKARHVTTADLKRAIESTAKSFNWKDGADPRANTMVMFSTVLGALMMSRIVDDERLSDKFLETARHFLKEKL